VEIGGLRIIDSATGATLLDLRGPEQLKSLSLIDDTIYLGLEESYTLLCYGDDPKLQIIPQSSFSGAARLELSIFVEPSFRAVAAGVAAEREKVSRDLKIVKTELTAAQSSRQLLAAELSHLATEKNSAERDLAAALKKQRDLVAQHQAAEADLLQKQKDLAAQYQAAEAASSRRIALLEEESRKRVTELSRAQAALASERAVIDSVVRSLSWRVTAPLRSAMMLIRRRPRGAKQT
jgi:hypothetical protein